MYHKKMQYPRIELGSREWQSRILPLNQYCTLHMLDNYLEYLKKFFFCCVGNTYRMYKAPVL